MPSIVLLMRSRLRIRPFSFSMRMPSSSSYWRLILRRPASSFGRSSWPSSLCWSSSSRMLKPLFLLLVVAFSLLRARAIDQDPSVNASARCSRNSSRTPRRSRAARSRRTGRLASRHRSGDSGGSARPPRPSPRSSPSSPPCAAGAPLAKELHGRGRLRAGLASRIRATRCSVKVEGPTLRRGNSRATSHLSRHARPSPPAAPDRRDPRPSPGRGAAGRAPDPAGYRHGDPWRPPADGWRRRRRRRRDRDPGGHLRRRGMKCRRCGERAEVQLRAHNTAFCRPCYLFFFRRQVERAIAAQRMLAPGERLLVAVSGGKDSLALWDLLADLGYDTTGLYLGLAIGEYSDRSQEKVERFAAGRGLPLRVVKLEAEGPGLGVPAVAAATRRAPCAACGTMKRHYFDAAAFAGGFDVLATGHNLDDEAARLLGNVLRWQRDHLARQRPVLPPTHPKFVRKVKPLYLTSEYETAVYAFMRGIDYIVDECPNAAGATQLLYKEALDRLEVASPGTKLAFVKEFLRSAQPAFAAVEQREPQECAVCGMPAYGALCSFCSLVREVETRRARTAFDVPAYRPPGRPETGLRWAIGIR